MQHESENIDREREATRGPLDESHREFQKAITRFREGIARSQRISDEAARLQMQRRRRRWF